LIPEEQEERGRIRTFHEQVVLVVSFLGGIVFAGFVLVIGNDGFIMNSTVLPQHNIKPQDFLLDVSVFLALLSGLSAITVIHSLFSLTWNFRSLKGMRRNFLMGYVLLGAVLFLFVLSFSYLLEPIDFEVAIFLNFVLIVILVVVLGLNKRFQDTE
jgi:heme A synthase